MIYYAIESVNGYHWAGDGWSAEEEDGHTYTSEKIGRVHLDIARVYGGNKAQKCNLLKYSREVINA